jgi:hypothetical protein
MNPLSSHILTAILRENKVLLNYRLGAADGITLLSRRGPESEFSEFAEDESPPVIDARPKLDPDQPETRRYRAVLRYSSNENRQFSNEIELTLP